MVIMTIMLIIVILGDVLYFLLQLFDGRMQRQKVCQQDQTKQCASHYHLEDVIAAVKELNTKLLNNL